MLRTISLVDLLNCDPTATLIDVGTHAGALEMSGAIRYNPVKLLAAHHLMLPIARESQVILYSQHAEGENLWRIATRMSSDGFTDVRVYLGTLDEYVRAGGRTQAASYQQVVPPSPITITPKEKPMHDSGSAERPEIVLIHGLFLTHASWDTWIARYRERGYIVHAPGWPGLDGSVEELRADPTPLTKLSISTVLEYYCDYIEKMSALPIVMGHSFGGLFAQLLAYRGLAKVAVGVDPTAPAGVLSLPFSTLKSSAPVLANPLNVGKATMLTPEQFHYAFANTCTEEESLALYDRYAIPCANRVLFEGAFENFAPHSPAHVDVAADRPPLLLIAGGSDHLVPAGYTRSNAKLIGQSTGITAFKEFPGRPHFTGAVPGWEAVADYAIEWAELPVATELNAVA